MPRKRLTEEKKSIVREKAAAAARRIIDEHGREKVTIRGIAKEVGISAMTLYTYFENKANIIAYLQLQAICELGKDLASAEKTLAGLETAYLSFADEKPDDFYLIFDGRKLSSDALESLKNALRPLQDAISGELPTKEVDLAVVKIWSQWHGRAVLKHYGAQHFTSQ